MTTILTDETGKPGGDWYNIEKNARDEYVEVTRAIEVRETQLWEQIGSVKYHEVRAHLLADLFKLQERRVDATNRYRAEVVRSRDNFVALLRWQADKEGRPVPLAFDYDPGF